MKFDCTSFKSLPERLAVVQVTSEDRQQLILATTPIAAEADVYWF